MSPANIHINRCLCEKKRFADIVPSAIKEGLTFSELSRRTGCGTHCGLCRPYLKRALQTGETEFHEILVDDYSDLLPPTAGNKGPGTT